jgi:hypothetical protein
MILGTFLLQAVPGTTSRIIYASSALATDFVFSTLSVANSSHQKSQGISTKNDMLARA